MQKFENLFLFPIYKYLKLHENKLSLHILQSHPLAVNQEVSRYDETEEAR